MLLYDTSFDLDSQKKTLLNIAFSSKFYTQWPQYCQNMNSTNNISQQYSRICKKVKRPLRFCEELFFPNHLKSEILMDVFYGSAHLHVMLT